MIWPKDTTAARNAFYGDPARGEVYPQLVTVTVPWQMYFDKTPVRHIKFHRKAAPYLAAALNEIWRYYGKSQKNIDKIGLSKYSGAYNHRMVRGSKTKWSNHAYGCAIDFNAAENWMGTKGNMPQAVINAFLRQGAMWGGYYRGRTDPMHFEFVDNGGRRPTLGEPVAPTPAPIPEPPKSAPKPAPASAPAAPSVVTTPQFWQIIARAFVNILKLFVRK